MGLSNIPADIFIELSRVSTVATVLSLRQVCTKFNNYSRLRSIWFTFFTRLCASYDVPRSFCCQALSTGELERLTTRPERFQAALRALASTTTTIKTPVAQRSIELPDPGVMDAKLVRGGRWLVTLSVQGSLKVWDLGCNSTLNFEFDLRSEYAYCPDTLPGDLKNHRVVDAYEYGQRLVIVAGSSRIPLLTTVLSLDLKDESASIMCVASCSHSGDASFYGALGAFAPPRLENVICMWNWEKDESRMIQLQAPPGAGGESLVKTKLVSGHLIALYTVGCRTEMSLYSLLDDQWLVPSMDPDKPALLVPLCSRRFSGMHHVETHRAASQPGSDPTASSSNAAFVRIHLRSLSTMAFHINTVAFSDPYWLIPPKGPHRGMFRIAIAMESRSVQSVRTRLQYYARINLNAYAPEVSVAPAKDCQSQAGSSGTGDATTGGVNDTAILKLRGRVSSRNEPTLESEMVGAKGAFWVGLGEQTIVSVWNGRDGIHAHTSTLERPPPTPRSVVALRQSSPPRQPSKPAFTVRTRGAPTKPPPTGQEAPSMKAPRRSTDHEAMGSDVVLDARAAAGPQESADHMSLSDEWGGGGGASFRPAGLGFEPSEAMRRLIEGSMRRRRTETRASASMDVFSGKLVVVSERMEGSERVSGRARIVEYV